MVLTIYGLNPEGVQTQVQLDGLKSKSQTSGRVVCEPTAAGNYKMSPYAMGRKHVSCSVETFTTNFADALYHLELLVSSSSVVFMQNDDANLITTSEGSYPETWAIIDNYEVTHSTDNLSTISLDFTPTTFNDDIVLSVPNTPIIPPNEAPIDGNMYINGICVGGLLLEPSYSNSMNPVKTEIPYGFIQAFTNSRTNVKIDAKFFSNNFSISLQYIESLLDGVDTGTVYIMIPGDKFGAGSIWTGTWACIDSYDMECTYYDGMNEYAECNLSLVTTDDYSESTYKAPLYPGPVIYPTPELAGRHGMYPSREQLP
jgi:hypothetical protein